MSEPDVADRRFRPPCPGVRGPPCRDGRPLLRLRLVHARLPRWRGGLHHEQWERTSRTERAKASKRSRGPAAVGARTASKTRWRRRAHPRSLRTGSVRSRIAAAARPYGRRPARWCPVASASPESSARASPCPERERDGIARVAGLVPNSNHRARRPMLQLSALRRSPRHRRRGSHVRNARRKGLVNTRGNVSPFGRSPSRRVLHSPRSVSGRSVSPVCCPMTVMTSPCAAGMWRAASRSYDGFRLGQRPRVRPGGKQACPRPARPGPLGLICPPSLVSSRHHRQATGFRPRKRGDSRAFSPPWTFGYARTRRPSRSSCPCGRCTNPRCTHCRASC